MRRLQGALPVAAVMVGLLARGAWAQQNYIALGDSYAFGYSTAATSLSNGNQGYASIVRDVFASRSGQTVTLANLAIPGETTNSYFSGTTQIPGYNPVIYDAPARAPSYNTNYAATPSEFQVNKFADTVAAIKAANQQVNYVTLQLGGNDFLGLFAQPNFQALSTSAQSTLISNRLQLLGANLNQALAGIKTRASTAQVYVIGYADVFAGLGASNPIPQSAQLTQLANSIIANAAAQNNATYINIYTPFLGHETEYSRILTQDPPGSGTPNVHPTDLGYRVIATQITAPEPGSVALVLVGALPLVGLMVRRRK